MNCHSKAFNSVSLSAFHLLDRKKFFCERLSLEVKNEFNNLKCKKSKGSSGWPAASRAKPFLKKLLLCIWWGIKGMLYYELPKPSENCYC